MHEILILFVIAIIVGFQIKIFLDAGKKIDLFKEIIPDASNFKTVKVFIPESQIKDIKVEYILSNLNKFRNPLGSIEKIKTKQSYDADEDSSLVDDDTERKVSKETTEEIINYETLIWISKGSEEKKIKLKLLKSHEMTGWKRIE